MTDISWRFHPPDVVTKMRRGLRTRELREGAGLGRDPGGLNTLTTGAHSVGVANFARFVDRFRFGGSSGFVRHFKIRLAQWSSIMTKHSIVECADNGEYVLCLDVEEWGCPCWKLRKHTVAQPEVFSDGVTPLLVMRSDVRRLVAVLDQNKSVHLGHMIS